MFIGSLLVGLALAAEPVAPVATTSPSVAARDAYLTDLNAAREQIDIDGVFGQCTAAKASFRGAQGEIASIDAELSIPVNPALGALETDHRAKLVALKAIEAKNLAAATALASRSGAALKAAEDKLAAIDKTIDRINAEKRAEKKAEEEAAAARLSSYDRFGDSGLGATGLNENMMNGIGGLIGSKGTQMGSGGLYARGAPVQPRVAPSPLPAEFSGCFPNEVATSS